MKRNRAERKVFSNVQIIDTANEGLAMGRCEDGRIIQVRYVVPGDVVDAEVIEKRKGMLIARPVQFHQQSSYRTTPFCDHFGVCGGCKWQHMSYEAQLHFKEKTTRDAFSRLGGLDISTMQPIVGATPIRYYRNKLEYTASNKRWLTDEEMRHRDEMEDISGIGFHLPGSFDKVLNVEHCHLQASPSNEIRLFIRAFAQERGWSFMNVKTKEGFLRNLIVRLTMTGDVMVVVVVGEEKPDEERMLMEALISTFPSIRSMHICVNPKVNDSIHDLDVRHVYGDETIVETLGHVKFNIGPKSFFQTNSHQAVRLYQMARDMAKLKSSDHVYDLYCGVGSLGLFMADQCQHVVGIEIIPEAIEDAQRNAQLNDIYNASFMAGQVELLLDPDFIARYGKPDVVMTDPPRAGMHPNAVEQLNRCGADRIVYISCNPATQARDIKMMSDHYRLVSSVPVDMFPHTHHIECIALLQRI